MNQRQRNNNIFMGGALIFLAIYVIVSRLADLPNIPVFKICFTALFVYLIYKGIKKKDYGMIFIPGALVLCQYDNLLGIEEITPWIVIVAACLLTAGFNMMFHRGRIGKNIPIVYNSGDSNSNFCDYKYDGENKKIVIDNNLGAITRYITEEELREVRIDNGLGQCTVYFQGCTLENNMLKVDIDNGLGACSVYFPKEWSINLTQDNGLGAIRVNGNPSADPQSPCVNVHVDNGLGAVDLNFI